MNCEKPWTVDSLDDCFVYHTTECGGATVPGEWDLRPVVAKYTGNQDLRHKRVLDVGTASGFNAFYFEKQLADVVAFDQSDSHPLNLLPHWSVDRFAVQRMKRGFWYFHRQFKSKVKVLYGNVYDLPIELGTFDYAFMGSILLHLENPIGAVRSVSRLAKRIIISDGYRPEIKDEMMFRPAYPSKDDFLYWWYISPKAARKILESFGYQTTEPTFCQATSPLYGTITLYTVVGTKI